METIFDEYGGMMLAVMTALLLIGMVTSQVQESGMLAQFVIEHCMAVTGV